jgi:myo-inositol-1-phosphate synthase
MVRTVEEANEAGGVPDRRTLEVVRDDLEEIDDRVKMGTARQCGQVVQEMSQDSSVADVNVAECVEQIREDYSSFMKSQGIDRLIVVNLASTEPPMEDTARYDTLTKFETAIENDDRMLPASTLYAYAALVDEHPYVNFTPGTGSGLGGLKELAERKNVPHMGRDGKTGETLVKSALAPMFAGRNLRVLSWEGHNILGNRDGLVLEDDGNKAGKIASKGDVLGEILGYDTHNAVRIDYTPSLGDWKTAWDHIHFQGFLETKMKMQFTWEGSDSALAAPLVLDLVRLAAFADDRNEGGLQPQLASFFKSPQGVEKYDLSRQFQLLYDYVEHHASGHD